MSDTDTDTDSTETTEPMPPAPEVDEHGLSVLDYLEKLVKQMRRIADALEGAGAVSPDEPDTPEEPERPTGGSETIQPPLFHGAKVDADDGDSRFTFGKAEGEQLIETHEYEITIDGGRAPEAQSDGYAAFLKLAPGDYTASLQVVDSATGDFSPVVTRAFTVPSR